LCDFLLDNPMQYIGITGITTREQSQSLLDYFKTLENPKKIRLMLGLFVSDKTLTDIPTSPRYAAKIDLKSIFIKDDTCLNLVHFNTHRKLHLARDLRAVHDLTPNIDGVQTNIYEPGFRQLLENTHRYPADQNVFQISARYFDSNSSVHETLEKLIDNYRNFYYYFLVDLSGGRGVEVDIGRSRELISYVTRFAPRSGIALAGGLNSRNFSGLDRLFYQFPGLSVDCESGVRDKNDQLDLPACRQYLKLGLKIMSLYPQ
jgi:phosphoribosylanthranilate isomerase